MGWIKGANRTQRRRRAWGGAATTMHHAHTALNGIDGNGSDERKRLPDGEVLRVNAVHGDVVLIRTSTGYGPVATGAGIVRAAGPFGALRADHAGFDT